MNDNEMFVKCFKLGAWCVGLVFLMSLGTCLAVDHMDNTAKVKVAQSCPQQAAAEAKK